MIVIDNETGKEFDLRHTDALSADLVAAYGVACPHTKTEMRRQTVKGGAIAYRMQCLTCGNTSGNAVPKASVPNPDQVPDMDTELSAKWARDRESRRQAVLQKHVRLQKRHSVEWWQQYNEYLQSDGWKLRRKLVMDRAGGLCEGCRLNTATQVHHLTYEHVRREFLWELVAVCDACHDRAHEDEEEEPYDPYAEEKARLEADNNEPFPEEESIIWE